MKDFTFYNPTRLTVGKGAIKKIGKILRKDNIKKAMIVYGKGSIIKNGVYDMVVNSLKENGIEFVEVKGIKPNPVLSKVEEAIETAKKENVEAIIAIGGGSVIDSSKAIATGRYIESSTWKIFTKEANVKKALPLYAVLTISATGTEMNGNFVITNEDGDMKWGANSIFAYPKVSIIDPTMQYSLPKNQIANGVVDTITHTLEYYFDGVQNNQITDEVSEAIIRTAINTSRVMIKDPEDYNARINFIWCSTMALNGISAVGKTGEWSSHMIEHSLSAFYDIAHGAGLAIILPAWMKYCYKNDIKKFARFAEKIFDVKDGSNEEKALKGIEKLKEYYKELGEPITLKEIGVKKSDFRKLAENVSLRYIPLGTLKKLEIEDIVKILEIAYE